VSFRHVSVLRLNSDVTGQERDAYTTYRDHPSHQNVLRNMILPKLDARAAVQYEVDD